MQHAACSMQHAAVCIASRLRLVILREALVAAALEAPRICEQPSSSSSMERKRLLEHASMRARRLLQRPRALDAQFGECTDFALEAEGFGLSLSRPPAVEGVRARDLSLLP